jgi:hypothetical protein
VVYSASDDWSYVLEGLESAANFLNVTKAKYLLSKNDLESYFLNNVQHM